MQHASWRLTAALALFLAIALPASPPAAAMAILGGGAVIVVDGNNYCTLTTIGHDRAGDIVGFTAAQCGGPGAPVAAAGSDDIIGTVAAVNPDLRYAVIRFDEPDLIPVSDYLGVAINGIGPDPEYDALVCKWGPTTPGICNRIMSAGWPRVTMREHFDAGDPGAPVTMDGLLVGMVYGFGVTAGSKVTLPKTLTYLTKFNAILADVNAGDGPGSGFVPIGR